MENSLGFSLGEYEVANRCAGMMMIGWVGEGRGRGGVVTVCIA